MTAKAIEKQTSTAGGAVDAAKGTSERVDEKQPDATTLPRGGQVGGNGHGGSSLSDYVHHVNRVIECPPPDAPEPDFPPVDDPTDDDAPPATHMDTLLANMSPEDRALFVGHATAPRVVVARSLDLAECPPLPEAARLDPALGADASPWLDAYIDFSRQWAPAAYDGFHETVALWVMSTVAARRVAYDLGKRRYTPLYFAQVARSSVHTKSTTHDIGHQTIKAAGLRFLLAPDESTPQALLDVMSRRGVPEGYDSLDSEQQEFVKLRAAFAAQRGWSYDELGNKVSAMMRDSGPMADFRGLLKHLDDCPDVYEYQTIARGSTLLRNPYLALLGSMTPADMRPYAKPGGALWGDGFWARFAFSCPPPDAPPGTGRFPEGKRDIPAQLVRGLRTWHDRLGIPTVEVKERLEDGKPPKTGSRWDVKIAPLPERLCILGRGVFGAFYTYRDALTGIAASGKTEDLDGNYSRFPEKALRVAALLASLESDGIVDMRHWARAQAIAERWRESLHNLYRTLGATDSDAGRVEDQIVDLVERLGSATPTDVRRHVRGVSTTEASLILEKLAKAGALRAEKTRKGTFRYAA